MIVGGVDRMDLYICAINSHGTKQPFRTILTPVRVVCANTLAAALGDKLPQELKIRHTKNAQDAIQVARETLELGWKYFAEFELEAERMVNTPLSTQKWESTLAKLFGKIERTSLGEPEKGQTQLIHKLDTVRGLLSAETQQNVKGTRWAGYNAITEYVDHFSPVFGRDDVALVSTNRASKAVQRGMDFKAQAFALLSH
jgi:phage/plasmid-like protein (TIGR03299 family)